MSKTTFEIEVQDDYLQRLAQVQKPILAVAELIWNAVDADADRVDVILLDDSLGGISAIEVADNGHGIPYQDASKLFSRLGGSWKQGGRQSLEKHRMLHGKEGRGRFRAFSLGRVVDWDVCYQDGEALRRYRLSMIKDRLKRVELNGETPAAPGHRRGVTVSISELVQQPRSLRSPSIADELAQIFALYLRQYPSVKIVFAGTLIDPSAVEEHVARYDLPDITTQDGETYPASLEIVEWRMRAERRLFFCDARGFPLDDATPGVQAPGFNFTAYLKSDYFSKLLAENRLEIATLDGPTDQALNAAKNSIREHFRRRASEKAAGLVAEWQREKIYPYQDEPEGVVAVAERQVFNVVALSVNHYLPAFQGADEKTKRLQLRLLRHAIETAPADLARILNEVLDLPTETRQELAGLLDRTTLAAIIGASKIVGDRLNYLRGLETLVFDEDFREKLRERTQLHRIIAENSWMFGEQYHLSVDDQSLTEVLKKHIRAQDREIQIDTPVQRLNGTRGIVDLMFSRNISRAGSAEREHLIVELKRPKVPIDSHAADQIESYALAVADDERFKDVNTKWVFWAVSNDVTEQIRRRSTQANRPRGLLYQDDKDRTTIWVKTWAQLIEECRARLRFFEEKLQFTPDRDSSLAHLKATYSRHLSNLFSAQVDAE